VHICLNATFRVILTARGELKLGCREGCGSFGQGKYGMICSRSGQFSPHRYYRRVMSEPICYGLDIVRVACNRESVTDNGWLNIAAGEIDVRILQSTYVENVSAVV